MWNRGHHNILILATICLFLFSVAGFSACVQPAPTAPTKKSKPAITEGNIAPPEEAVVKKEEPAPQLKSTPPQEPAPPQEPV